MKLALDEKGKFSKSGKLGVLECLSEFISFVTSEASEICKKDNRKTITPEDIICSLDALNFDHYTTTLRLYINKYRNVIKLFFL